MKIWIVTQVSTYTGVTLTVFDSLEKANIFVSQAKEQDSKNVKDGFFIGEYEVQ